MQWLCLLGMGIKMDVTTASLLANQLQTLDPKATAKETATKILQESADIPLSLGAQKSGTTPNNAHEVIGTLLGSAVSEAKSKSAIFEILQNNQLFKNMGNFAEDIKNLTSLIKIDSTIVKPMALLQLFSKSVEQLDVKMLQEQVNNSGVFFESKLANLATQKEITQTLSSLSTEILEHFQSPSKLAEPFTNEIKKVLTQLNGTSQPTSKETQESLKYLLDLFRQSVKVTLNEPMPPMKEMYQTMQKLDYAIQQMDLIGSKIENYPKSMNVDEHFTTQVKVYLELAKESLGSLQLSDLEPQINQLLTKESLAKASSPLLDSAMKSPLEKVSPQGEAIEESLLHVKEKNGESQTLKSPTEALKEPLLEIEEPLQSTLASSTPTQSATNVLQASASTLKAETVEEALKMVVSRIKQQIAMVDPKSVEHADFMDKSTLLEQKIHSLIKPELFVGKAMAQKLSLDPTDVELLSDMKGVLTKLSDSLPPTPQNKEALEITNRLLTQIEYHQLFSYVSSSTHLYIPFSWEGLNGGSMMMKQSSDESFHCQIDLDLEAYGKLNMMLQLTHEKYIDLTIAVQKKELQEKITEELTMLKRALNEVGLVTGNVKMLEYKDVTILKNDYFNGEQLQFGINIKI